MADVNKNEVLRRDNANITYKEWKKEREQVAQENEERKQKASESRSRYTASNTNVTRFDSDDILLNDYDTIKRKHDINDDVKNTNPNYNSGIEYKINCQRCVNAFEARCRGYDVIAEKKAHNSTRDELSNITNKNGWPNVYDNGDKNIVSCQSRSVSGCKRKIEKTMDSYGVGSRAIIRVVWNVKKTTGHVFIAVNENGNIRYVDPQTGDTDASWYLSSGTIKPKETFLLRIDDKKFTSLIQKCVKK